MKKCKKNYCLFIPVIVILTCVLFTCSILCDSSKVSAEEISYFSDEKLITDSKKSWTVRFNFELDQSTINENSMYIYNNSAGTKIPVEVKLLDDKKSIEIKPLSDYISGDSYTIYIKDSLKSNKSKSLKKTVALDFRMASSIEQVNSYVNSLFTCIKVKTSSKVFSVKINDNETQYDGDGVYSLNSFDISSGTSVKITTYDSKGNIIDTMSYRVK